MALLDALHEYFRGERMLGYALPFFALALLAVALWTYRAHEPPFSWGLALPLLVAGLAGILGGPILVARTDRQVVALERGLEDSPEATLTDERARMAAVNANWPRLKIGWAALNLLALVLLFAVPREWAKGLGLSLLLLSTTLFFVDVFAERRAIPYTAALEAAAS